MIFDSLILSAVIDELTRILTGGKIEKITQPTPLDVVIRVFTNNGKYDLLFSSDADFARTHLTWVKRENPPQPYAFCALLRKHVDGARVTGFERPSGFGERILVVRLTTYEGTPFSLVVEIMGRHSNIVLLNGAEMILGATKHVSSEINRYREILPGLAYTPPPRQRGKIDPLELYAGDEVPLTDAEGESWLVQKFAGVSPMLAHEIAVRTKERSQNLTQESLWQCLSDTLSVVRTGDFAPIVWTDDAGTTLGAYPIHLHSVPDGNQHDRPSISVALDNASDWLCLV